MTEESPIPPNKITNEVMRRFKTSSSAMKMKILRILHGYTTERSLALAIGEKSDAWIRRIENETGLSKDSPTRKLIIERILVLYGTTPEEFYKEFTQTP